MPVNLNRYPPWWNSDITLYNRDEAEDGTVTWYKTQLSGCYYAAPRATQRNDIEKVDADAYVCRIREDANYHSPADWSALDDKTSAYTLYTEDIIVPGHVDDEIDESGTNGLRSSELLEKYTRAGAFRITVASENTGVMVGSPHYKALGAV